MHAPLAYKIFKGDDCTEVHISGSGTHWDLLKIIHQLSQTDPQKEKPDLWVLAPDLDISLYSLSPLVQGILALMARFGMLKKGCKSAILATDELQKAKMELYCAEASVLPFEIQAFTARDQALNWLHS
jgi:hypothetical protein